jgi:hypothetical protein
MSIIEEQKPREADSQAFQVFNAQVPKKKIICKFWMMGNCIKDDKCPYLHTERDKSGFQNKPLRDTECNLYKLGFCKNGPLCNFKHVKEEKSDEELENLPELPIWFIESIIGKQISLIYQDFEQQNPEEVSELKAKYMQTQQTRSKNKFNYSNNNNNRFQNSQNKNLYKYDMYAEKKEQILESLNKKTRYFFIRNRNMDYVQFIMENNILLTTRSNAIKLNEALKSCDELVFIIFDEDSMNFNGFCRYKKDFDDNEMSVISEHYFSQYSKNLLENFKTENPIEINRAYVTVEWHWKTKLSACKVELLRNPLNENEVFINSKDNQEISVDLGYYICRMMIKRLTKDEVKEYMDYKKFCEESLAQGHVKEEQDGDRKFEKFGSEEKLLKLEGENKKTELFQNFEKYPQSLQLMHNYKNNYLPTIQQHSIPDLKSHNRTPYFHNMQNLQNIQPNIPSMKNNLNLNNILYEEIQKSTIKSGSSNSIPIAQFPKTHTLPLVNNSDTNNNSNIIVTNISNLQVNISQNSFQDSNFRNDKTYRKKYYDKTRRERDRSRSVSRDRVISRSRSRSRSRSISYLKNEDSKRKKYKRNDSRSRSRSRSRTNRLRYRSRSRGHSRSRNNKNYYDSDKRRFPSPSNRYDKGKYSAYTPSSYTTNSKSSVERSQYSPENRHFNENLKIDSYYDSSESHYLNKKRNFNYVENQLDSPKRNISFYKSSVDASSTYSDSKLDNKIIKNKLFSNAMEKIATNYLRRDSRGNK